MKPIRILPPRVFQLALLTVIAIHFLLPVWFIYNSPVRFIGLIPIVIENGPFRYSRNPIYLGMVLIIIGASFISGSVITFLVPICLAIILHFLYIREEEAILENSFWEIYLSYKHRVPCWI